MWNPDKAPALGFESLARRVGVYKARAIFAAYREKLRIDNVRVTKLEQAAAAARARRGPAVVKNDFEMMPAYHLAPLTFKQLHRSTLGQRGCKGGEVFDDDNDMGMDDSDDDDIDEEAFKEALEKAKAAAEKLSERPRSKK
jgi:hypothetical protein